MAAAPTLSIPRCTGVCASDGHELAPGEPIVVVLTETEDEELARTDYTVAAWEQASRDETGPVFATWRAEAPRPDKKQDAIISAEGLLDLFEQLGESTEPRRLAFRYVLALQLMRKRKLEYQGSRDGMLLVTPRGADEDAAPIEVHDPQASGELDEEALSDLAEQVESLMDPGDDD